MKRILLILLSLLVYKGVIAFCDNSMENGEDMIILWNYDEKLTYDFLESHKYEECMKKYSIYMKIDLQEFTSFNTSKLEFNFSPISQVKETVLYICDNLHRTNRGKLTFFSIVIDNNIILNGVNRIGGRFVGAGKHIGDDLKLLSIVFTVRNTIRLALDYTNAIIFEDQNESDISHKKRVLLSSYFNRKRSNCIFE